MPDEIGDWSQWNSNDTEHRYSNNFRFSIKSSEILQEQTNGRSYLDAYTNAELYSILMEMWEENELCR